SANASPGSPGPPPRAWNVNDASVPVTSPTIGGAPPSGTSVSTPSAYVDWPEIARGCPLAVTFQVNLPSSPIVSPIVVSFSGLAFHAPASFPAGLGCDAGLAGAGAPPASPAAEDAAT